uniref:Thyrotroph embryonic factor-like n=1 Tax=Actinia tenebrosa TaxID=6105 RepID=A0A6P8HS20_ACTTE
MSGAPSPMSSSNYSSISDSDTSNDSGVDSMSAGSLPPDYMDIDEFLIATGVKHFDSTSQNNLVQSFVSQGENLTQKSNIKKTEKTLSSTRAKQKSQSKVDEHEHESIMAKKPKSPTKKRHSDYSYKYNPLPMGKKAKRSFVSDDNKDDKYWKRRIRNNEAARRSRDMRRQREIEISEKWKQLEKENERLKKEVQKLKEKATELEKQLLEKHS